MIGVELPGALACIDFMCSWFSKYAVRQPTSSTSSITRRASARLRPSGFSQITPFRCAPPAATSSITATRQSLGAKTATTSTCGSISVTDSYTTASPRPRARALAASSWGGVREVIPATSTPRTLSRARRWKADTKPAPTMP